MSTESSSMSTARSLGAVPAPLATTGMSRQGNDVVVVASRSEQEQDKEVEDGRHLFERAFRRRKESSRAARDSSSPQSVEAGTGSFRQVPSTKGHDPTTRSSAARSDGSSAVSEQHVHEHSQAALRVDVGAACDDAPLRITNDASSDARSIATAMLASPLLDTRDSTRKTHWPAPAATSDDPPPEQSPPPRPTRAAPVPKASPLQPLPETPRSTQQTLPLSRAYSLGSKAQGTSAAANTPSSSSQSPFRSSLPYASPSLLEVQASPTAVEMSSASSSSSSYFHSNLDSNISSFGGLDTSSSGRQSSVYSTTSTGSHHESLSRLHAEYEQIGQKSASHMLIPQLAGLDDFQLREGLRRGSEYTSVSSISRSNSNSRSARSDAHMGSSSDWMQEQEKEREDAFKNSDSGVFDLEYDLARRATASAENVSREEAMSTGPYHPTHSLHPPAGRQYLLSLPENAVVASPSPTSPGFGLGITSDDAVHPNDPSRPSSSVNSPIAPANPAAEGITSGSGPASAVSWNSASTTLSDVQGGPSASRWTARPYLRRNTTSSVRSVHRVPSKPSPVDAAAPGPAWDPARHLRHATSFSSLQKRADSQPERPDLARSNSSTLRRQPTAPRRTRRRSPSFSAFSTSSNGHAALATLSYAESGIAPQGVSYTSRSRASTFSLTELDNELEELHPRHRHADFSADLDAAASPSELGDDIHLWKRPASQAIALVENGQSRLVELGSAELLEDLIVAADTTHLLLAGSSQPVELRSILTAYSPALAATLVVLDLSSCHLTAIPEAISSCFNLEELNISGNALLAGSLPAFLPAFQSLRVLLADACNLINLHASLASLQRLHTFSVRGNALTSLPAWLRHLQGCLEVLLVDGNPFFGAYANLVSPLLQTPSPLPSSISRDGSAPTLYAHSPGSLTSPSMLDLYNGNGACASPPDPLAQPARVLPPLPAVTSSRTSFMSRTRSMRNGLRRPSVSAAQNDSPVHSMLLADSSSANSGLTRRASTLRAMRSTGDLAAPQPSLHSLLGSPDLSLEDLHCDEFGQQTVPIRTTASTAKAMTIEELFRSEESETAGATYGEAENIEYDSALESDTDRHRPRQKGQTEAKHDGQERKPGFFRKLSLAAKEKRAKMERKRSMSSAGHDREKSNDRGKEKREQQVVPSLPRDASQTKLCKGRPSSTAIASAGLAPKHLPHPPFFSEDARSASAPAVTLNRERTATAVSNLSTATASSPALSPKASFTAAFKSATLGSKSRAPKQSKPVPISIVGNPVTGSSGPPSSKQNASKRRSYLMLNTPALLPEVVAPGPLTIGLPSDTRAVPASLEDETIVISHNPPPSSLPMSPPPPSLPDNARLARYAEMQNRRAALEPLMAYLRDLSDLTPESYTLNLDVTEARSPSNSATPDRQSVASLSVRRKTSLAAVSDASSRLDRNSGYESSKEITSISLASPSSLLAQHFPKLRDDPTKRERVVAEIVASEKTYLAGLSELVDLYITPASQPLRNSSNHTVRETVVPQAERALVFSVVESIAHFHTEVFLPELERAAAGVTAVSSPALNEKAVTQAAIEVASVFTRHAAYLKLYHSYTVNFQTTLERVKLWDSFLKSGSATPLQAQPSLPDMNGSGGKHSGTHQLSSSQKKRIRELLKTARKDPAHSQLGLQSYLLSPIQRIPRYKLLLEALAECTPSLDDPSQPDADLVIALRLISDLTLEMNEKTRDSEGRKRLLYWQARIKSRGQSPLVAPHRSLLKEGTMVLSRVVRRKSAIVTTKNAMSEEQTSLVQIHTLDVDTTPQTLLYLICSDSLILLTGSASDHDPIDVFTVVRLGRSLGGTDEPAALFGPQSMLRVIDSHAILYFTCADESTAQDCHALLNKQALANRNMLRT